MKDKQTRRLSKITIALLIVLIAFTTITPLDAFGYRNKNNVNNTTNNKTFFEVIKEKFNNLFGSKESENVHEVIKNESNDENKEKLDYQRQAKRQIELDNTYKALENLKKSGKFNINDIKNVISSNLSNSEDFEVLNQMIKYLPKKGEGFPKFEVDLSALLDICSADDLRSQ